MLIRCTIAFNSLSNVHEVKFKDLYDILTVRKTVLDKSDEQAEAKIL